MSLSRSLPGNLPMSIDLSSASFILPSPFPITPPPLVFPAAVAIGNYNSIHPKTKTTVALSRKTIDGMAQPIVLPTSLCIPDLVVGMPICLASLALTDEMPRARFHEKENPYFFPILAPFMDFCCYYILTDFFVKYLTILSDWMYIAILYTHLTGALARKPLMILGRRSAYVRDECF
jgi:hypothetical protein